jgi:hypothetical protein
MKKIVTALTRAALILFASTGILISCTKDKTGAETNHSVSAATAKEQLTTSNAEAIRWLHLIDVCKKKRFKITYRADLFPVGTTIYVYFTDAVGNILTKKSFPCVPNIETTKLFFIWEVSPGVTKAFLSTTDFTGTTVNEDSPCGERPDLYPEPIDEPEDAYLTPYDCIETCD